MIVVKHNIVKYIANKREEQEQIRQRINRQQELIRNNRDKQIQIFEQHNIARKQHQKNVQEEHLKLRDEKRWQQEQERAKQEQMRIQQEQARIQQEPLRVQQEQARIQQEQEQVRMQQERARMQQKRAVVFDKTKHYYVCSYGGCGSKMLIEYLSHFGNVYHIHSRYPPEKLQYIGNKNNQHTHTNQYEWFIDKEIPEDQLSNYTVFYIYRNPISAIYSRFLSPTHLHNIQCQNINLQIQDIIDSSSDLYGIEEFFDNYMNLNASRNYTIYGIKYDQLFENMSQFNTFFNLPDDPKIYPVKNERNREKSAHYLLEIIYGSFIRKMETYDFISTYRSKM